LISGIDTLSLFTVMPPFEDDVYQLNNSLVYKSAELWFRDKTNGKEYHTVHGGVNSSVPVNFNPSQTGWNVKFDQAVCSPLGGDPQDTLKLSGSFGIYL
jgi:hypothetical protein